MFRFLVLSILSSLQISTFGSPIEDEKELRGASAHSSRIVVANESASVVKLGSEDVGCDVAQSSLKALVHLHCGVSNSETIDCVYGDTKHCNADNICGGGSIIEGFQCGYHMSTTWMEYESNSCEAHTIDGESVAYIGCSPKWTPTLIAIVVISLLIVLCLVSAILWCFWKVVCETLQCVCRVITCGMCCGHRSHGGNDLREASLQPRT